VKAIFTPLVIGTLIAAAVNSVIFLIAAELLGEEFIVDPDGIGGEPSMVVPAIMPAVFTVFQAIVGGVIAAAIALATKSPKYTWRLITLVGLSLSFVPTAFASLGETSTFLWLSAMHVVAGALVIPLVERVLPANKNKAEDGDTTETSDATDATGAAGRKKPADEAPLGDTATDHTP
jgi:hypothetical protein